MKPNSKAQLTKRKSSAATSRAKKDKEKWNDAPVGEDDYFTDKDFEQLLSLEVLTDYQITKDGQVEYPTGSGHSTGDTADSDEDDEGMSDDDNGDGREKERILEAKDDDVPKLTKSQKQKKVTVGKKRKAAVMPEEDSNQIKKKVQKGRKGTFVGAEPGASADTVLPSTSSWTVVDIAEENARDRELFPTQTPVTKKKKPAKEKPLKTAGKKGKLTVDAKEVPEPSPTFNSEAWSKLGVQEPILRALSEAHFDTPTPIQNLTLGASILGKKDVVGAAETGSGKTLAFAIPILQGILEDRERAAADEAEDESEGFLRALILTPTRELALQIQRHMDVVSTYTNINVVVIVGGLSEQKQERLLRLKPEIVIATIGRFWEMVQNGNVHLSNLGQIRYLAIDETDRMVEKGHFQELEGILEVLNSNPEDVKRRQNFVFSATLAFTHEPPERLTRKAKRPLDKKRVAPEVKLREIMGMLGIDEKDAKVVDITTRKGTCETLVEMTLTCQLNQKESYLYYFFLVHPGRTIVFCNSINSVRRLVNLFYLLKMDPVALHSEMVQKQRLRSLERFAENEKGILIATDVAARGLDITNIQHVIHYQVPKTAESYIHRSGRTARAFKGGLALVLIEPSETTNFWNISRSLGREELLPSFPVDGQILHQIKARVELAIKVEQFEHQVRKKSADINWIEKARKDMDLATSDEDREASDSDAGGKQMSKKNLKKDKTQLTQVKEQLDQLLASNSTILRQNQRVFAAFNKIISEGGAEKSKS